LLGQIGLAPNVSHAASATVSMRLVGKGGHGAHPHLCADPIVAGAYLITSLQSIISRNTPPLDSAVLTIGRFQAGTAVNIIPNEAQIHGTLRTLRDETRELIVTRLQEMIAGLERTYRVSGELNVVPGYPLLVNDSRLAQFCLQECRELLGESQILLQDPVMGAEDFAYFSQRYPALMIRLGCKDPTWDHSRSLHSPYFDLDERVLDLGVRLFSRLLINYHGGVGAVDRIARR
jgi:amidohydrolase